MNSRKRVLIVGAGLAGIAAAVALADEDFEVILIERRGVLGGRASSFVDPDTGESVDNCQHVLMRCCTNLMHLYRRLEVDSRITFYREFLFIGQDNRSSILRAVPLPPPFHFAPSLVGFTLLSMAERVSLARALLKLITERNLDQTAGEWLRGQNQTERIIDCFWGPILVSALNEDPNRASLRYARQVFVDGFMATRESGDMGLPNVALHELYEEPVVHCLEQRGGRVLVSAPVQSFECSAGSVDGIVFRDGDRKRADYYVAAVPFEALVRMLPASTVESNPCFAGLHRLEHSPIVAVHLFFDRVVNELDYAAMPGRTIQWMFNKRRNFQEKRKGDYLGLVVSAAREFISKTRNEIIEQTMNDIRAVFPGARDARMTRAVVIKEPRATFSATPESDLLRPDQSTPLENLFIAGDWTRTGWPATMEGAVRSGYRCAELVMEREGRRKPIVQPDLRPEGLMERLSRRGKQALTET